jgi:hypothetical protein
LTRRTQTGVIKHKLLRKIFLLNSHDVTVGKRKLHNEKLHNLYSFQNTIQVITTDRLRMEHTAHMGVKKSIDAKL